MKNAEWPPCKMAPIKSMRAVRRKLKLAKFPRFEDVSPEEARTITEGAPRSGRFQREHGYSLIGSAAALCEREP